MWSYKVNGRKFTGIAKSKKEAKKCAAVEALYEVFGIDYK